MSGVQTAPAAAAADGAAPNPGRGRGRSIGAVVCFVLAVLLTLLSLVAYWGQRTINDTGRYVDTVGPLIESPEVQQAIATTVTNAIEKQINVEATLNEVFAGVITDRPRLEKLVGPIAGAVNGLIEREVNNVVASDTFQELWITANTRTQERLTALLRGEQSGAISIQGDSLVLDVGDVIEQVKQRLVARGLTFLNNLPIPDVDKQIVLLTAPQLQQAQTIYAFTNPVATWLIWVVLALYLGAFLLSRRRARMAVAIGISLLANAFLLAFGLSVGRQLFVNELSGTVFGPASSIFWDTLLAYLVRGWQVMAWLGLAIVVGGWFAGRNASGTACRGFVAGALHSAGAPLGRGGMAGIGRWFAGNARWLRWIAVAIGFVVLMWGTDISPSKLAWSVVLVLVLLVVVEVLAGAGGAGAAATNGPAGAEPAALADSGVTANVPTDTLVVPTGAERGDGVSTG